MNPNVICPRYTRFFAWVLPVLLSACATWHSESEEQARIGILSWHSETQQLFVGTLEASGENVWLNGKPAATGMEVYSGDEVSTGAASKAYVRFSSGGFIHIDENTDPIFDWLKSGACVLCKIGQIFVDAAELCVKTPHLGAGIGSQIHIKVTDDATTLSVLEGEARLEGPEAQVIRSNEQVMASQSGVEPPRRVPKEELLAAIEWHTGVKVALAPVTQPVERIVKAEPSSEPTETVRLDDIFFGFDDDTIRADQEARLDEIADELNNHPTMRILVEGYSDPRGAIEYNRVLALRRATAVQNFLVKRGIASGRIEAVSRGGAHSLSSCRDEVCWAQNRRAHFTIISR
jgi:outer membrane protein OmpA-like peptidoglycan-associated protein